MSRISHHCKKVYLISNALAQVAKELPEAYVSVYVPGKAEIWQHLPCIFFYTRKVKKYSLIIHENMYSLEEKSSSSKIRIFSLTEIILENLLLITYLHPHKNNNNNSREYVQSREKIII